MNAKEFFNKRSILKLNLESLETIVTQEFIYKDNIFLTYITNEESISIDIVYPKFGSDSLNDLEQSLYDKLEEEIAAWEVGEREEFPTQLEFNDWIMEFKK